MKIIDTQTSDPIEALEVLNGLPDDERKHAQEVGAEYLKKNLKIRDRDSFEELKEELSNIDSLKSKHVLKLLEILPNHEEEVEALFSKERVKLDDTEIQQIVDICSSFSAE
jgi:DNA-directed RNA polymerase subunit F